MHLLVMVNCLSLLSLLHTATSTTYYVIPDNYPLHNYTNSNTFPLQHYLNNTSEYFVSHNQLHFLPGQYYINSDLVFKHIYNFTLIGNGINQSAIICSSPASILVINADRFTIKNVIWIDYKSLSKSSITHAFNMSVLFADCSSVTMQNVYVNVSSDYPTGLVGIYIMDVAKSEIIDVTVQVNILKCHNHPVKIYGCSVIYSHSTKVQSPRLIIQNFNYYAQKSCLQYSQCIIKCITSADLDVSIKNTVFANLSNTSALCY